MKNKKQSKKHWEKPGNTLIKQKYKLAQKLNQPKSICKTSWRNFLMLQY